MCLCVCVCVCVCVVVCVVDKPTSTVHVDFKKCMRPESDCKSTAEDVTQHTTEVLRYKTPLSGLWSDEQPRKTSLEAIKHENTLTVPQALFRRESVPF